MRRKRLVAVSTVLVLIAALATPALAADGGGTTSASGVDLALQVTGPEEAPRGTTFPIALRVSNQGSETATGVSIVSYLGDALSLDGHTGGDCVLDEYDSLNCTVADLGPGTSALVELTVTRVAARETWVDAWTASSAQESDWEDNYGGLYLAADRTNPADVQVEVTSPEQPEVGETFSYEAVVTDRGPELARSVEFTQSLSDGVDFVSVTSSDPTDTCSLHEETYDEEGFEGGPYTYREVRCQLGNMQFAEQTTITTSVVRNDPHELWSSAWISTTSYDANYDNDYSDASTAGHPSVTSDLIMTLDGPADTPLVGDDYSYTLSVTNAGPAPASDVTADTWLPEQLALRGITPSREGDVCNQSEYQGIACTFGTLAVGETASVTIDVTRVGARRYWIGGSVWSSNYDPDYETNYIESEVRPDRSVVADLAVDISGPKDPAVGSNFDYSITVTNLGPDAATATNARVSLPDGVEFVSATSPDTEDVCSLFEETYDDEGTKIAEGEPSSYTYREVRCDLGTLVPAESAMITVTLTRTSDFEMWASAWATTASFDDNYDNDWDGVGSFGSTTGGCGAPVEDDSGGFVACDEMSGGDSAGSGSYVATSRPGRRVMRTGAGNDEVTIHVPTHSKKHRRIVVNAGKGRDSIVVTLAPGAGNVTLILKGGAGRDRIEVLAPRPGKRFKVRMWGGAGSDTCSQARGDRHSQRAC